MSIDPSTITDATDKKSKSTIQEVKYSLKQLLIEVEEERSTSVLGKEMVDQMEIQKFFQNRIKKKRKKKTRV